MEIVGRWLLFDKTLPEVQPAYIVPLENWRLDIQYWILDSMLPPPPSCPFPPRTDRRAVATPFAWRTRSLRRWRSAIELAFTQRLPLGFCTRLFVVNFLFHPQSTGLVPVCLRLCRQPNHPRYKPGGFSSPSAPSGACASPTDPKRCPATAGRVQATALQRAPPHSSSVPLCGPLW